MSALWTISFWGLFVLFGFAVYQTIAAVDQINRDKEDHR